MDNIQSSLMVHCNVQPIVWIKEIWLVLESRDAVINSHQRMLVNYVCLGWDSNP